MNGPLFSDHEDNRTKVSAVLVPPNEEPEPFSYTAKRLEDPRDLEAILQHNLNNIDTWRSRYPNHARWIRAVIKGISGDDYTRLAFGVFVHGGDSSGKLVCSAIVKKDHFGPYLEIKNVILLNLPDSLDGDRLRTHKQHCYRTLIQHVQRFAESRGYTKLVTELFNRNSDERELIQAFLRCKFDVAGSHSRRYMPTDEIIILAYDVHPVYGLDPYDFDAASKWLINRYAPEFQIEDHRRTQASRPVEILVNDQRAIKKACLEFSSHRTDPESLRKFSMSCLVLVIESYLATNNGLTADDALQVKFNFDTQGRIYVFDFTPKKQQRPTLWERELFPKIRERYRDCAYFDRDELNDLLYRPSNDSPFGRDTRARFRVTADLPLEDVGGLLTLTDPTRLDASKVESNRIAGKNSIYIKLGAKGKFAQQGQILVFYFPSSDFSSVASVWGYAEIEEAYGFDIQSAREEQQGSVTAVGGDTHAVQRSDAEIVFDHIKQLEEILEVKARPLWKREDFEKHNTYNATNEVVFFYLTRFVDLRSKALQIDKIVTDKFRCDSIVKEIDAYISTAEAEQIRAHAPGKVSSQGSAILHPPSIVVAANQVEAGNKKMTSQFSQGHALIVAVANYPKVSKLPEIVLKDATDVADLLRSGEYCGYPRDNVRLLLDQNATVANIRREFAKLAKAADKNDTVVLFFSGHGGRVEGGKNAGSYLIPFDCDPGRLSETAIESSELTKLLSGIKCERLVVLLDACHSGGVGEVKAIAPVPEMKAGLNTSTYDALARGVGRVIMASSRVDEVSVVLNGMLNSLFTHYLIQGLMGAAPTRRDGLVHVFDLFRYISEEVPKRASQQHPIFKAHNVENDFAIALYLGGSKEPVHMRASAGRQDRLNPKTKLAIIGRLDDSWQDLAIYFDIPPKDIAKFPKGAEPRKILEWVEVRRRTAELRNALNYIGRDDLTQELDQGPL